MDVETRGLSENEKRRLLDGRLDWREDDWQDHCGDLECVMCDGALIPDGWPLKLSPEDQAVRAALQENHRG